MNLPNLLSRLLLVVRTRFALPVAAAAGGAPHRPRVRWPCTGNVAVFELAAVETADVAASFWARCRSLNGLGEIFRHRAIFTARSRQRQYHCWYQAQLATTSSNASSMARMSSPCLRFAVAFLTLMSTAATADVYRCTEGVRTIYSDKPCQDERSTQVNIPSAPASKLGAADVPDVAVRVCLGMYGGQAIDPTAVKYVSHSGPRASDYSFDLFALFPNKYGAREQRMLWCPLTRDLRSIDSRRLAERMVKEAPR
jgi:hypothetical protein